VVRCQAKPGAIRFQSRRLPFRCPFSRKLSAAYFREEICNAH
jgi:hypothetical protein